MKRTLFSLVFMLSAVCIMAQNVGEAFYVYRNDGQFNAFFRSEVDSITYSYEDIEGNLYDDIVTQLVHTPDTVVAIPLSVIDSVGFVRPETQYQPGVIVLKGNIREYVLSSDSLTIIFMTDTPVSLLPRVGDKLVTDECSETFLAGFAGEVESVRSGSGAIEIICKKVNLEDVFKYYYYSTEETVHVTRALKDDNQQNMTWEKTWSPGRLNLSLSALWDRNITTDSKKDLSYQVETNADFSLTPTYKIQCHRVVSPVTGSYVSLKITEDDNCTQEFALSGHVDESKDFVLFHFPFLELGIPFLQAYIEVGAFLRGKCTVEANLHFEQNYRSGFLIEASSRNLFIPRINVFMLTPLSHSYKGEALINGEISGGVFGELGVEFFDKDILSIAVRGEAGLTLGGNIVLHKKDTENALQSTDLYKKLLGTNVYVNGFVDFSVPRKFLGFEWDDFGKQKDFELIKGSVVPEFTDTKIERNYCFFPDDEIIVSTKAKGFCLPCDLGFTLFEKQSTEGTTSYVTYNYKGGNADLSEMFHGESDSCYNVYPTVKLMGLFEILADPYAEEEEIILCPDDNHPHAIDLGMAGVWSCCNVGASKPEEFGNYYAWGETGTKSNYSLETYKYYSDTHENKDLSGGYTKYCSYGEFGYGHGVIMSENGEDGVYIDGFTDGLTELETKDDAAAVNWGNSWRTPSYDQFFDLQYFCCYKWTQVNQVYGLLLKGNGNYIFLPAVGYRDGESMCNAGLNGNYWLRNSFEDTLNPFMAISFDIIDSAIASGAHDRASGLTVRPVHR